MKTPAHLLLAMLAFTASGIGKAVAAEKTTPQVDDAADDDAIISLAAYNVKTDRIEDFGLRVKSQPIGAPPKTTVGFFVLAKFSPVIIAILPNTAAAKAGLEPGERILKSDGKSTIGGAFSTGKFGNWSKTQKAKWAQVAAGRTNIAWTLEVENPATKAVRTVKLVVPTPPPHWGASVWRKPERRVSAVVAEPGPLAQRSCEILDHGIWTLLDAEFVGQTFGAAQATTGTGYRWELEGHQMLVTQFRGRTDVVLVSSVPRRGVWHFLTSPSGRLERAWSWGKGKPGEKTLAEAQVAFDYALEFWITHVQPGTGRWPFEIKPGYNAAARAAAVAAHYGAPAGIAAATRPLAEKFLKLRPATDAERALFADAYGKLGIEQDRWAYTETARNPEDSRVLVTRVDPSQPEAHRCVLLSIDGRTPTAAEIQEWRDAGADLPQPLGEIPPLATVADMADVRIHRDDIATLLFELPVRGGSAEFPPENFQALFRVNKSRRAFEEITLTLRDAVRVAGVVKITDAGFALRFESLDPSLAPQPVWLKAGGGARVLFAKISRSFEATRTDFRRVEPFEDSANRNK